MSTDDIQVRISAQIDELISGMNTGMDAITSRLDAMQERAMAAGEALGAGVGQGANTATQELAKADQELQGIGGTLDSVNSKFHELMEFLGLRYAYLIGKKLVEELDEVSESFIKMSVASQSLNITVEQMQGLETISRDAAVPVSNLMTLMGELQGRLARAAEEGGQQAQVFEALGISLQQMADPSYTVVDAMEQMGAAGNSNKEILAALGERGQNLLPVLREIAADHGLIAEKFKEVHGLTDEEIASLYQYHQTMTDVEETVSNTTARIEGGLVPAVQELIREFGELIQETPEETDAMGGLKEAMDEVVLSVMSLIYAFKGAVDVILSGLKLMIEPLVNFAAALNQAIHGNFKGAREIQSELFHQMSADFTEMTSVFETDSAKGDAAISRLRASLAGLSDVIVTAQKENAGANASLPSLAVPDLSGAKGIGTDLMEETRQLMAQSKQMLAESLADAVSNAKQQLDAKEGELKKEQDLVDQAYKHHQISATQDYQQTVSILNQKWAATEAYYQKLEGMYQSDAKAEAAVHAQEEAEHQKYLTQLEKAQDDYNAHVVAQWKWATDGMKNALSTAIKDMLTTYHSFGEDMKQMMISILDTLINKLADWVSQWVMNWIMAKITTQTTAASQISANAGVAAAAAMGSVAAIPYVGWAMAPGVGASTLAQALSYESLAAAAGGWEVPSDQLAMVHKDEMVLPASLSQGLKSLIGNGGGGPSVTHNYGGANFNMLDTRGLHDLLGRASNRSAVARALASGYRRGARV